MYENKTYNNEANYFRRNVGSEKKMTNFLDTSAVLLFLFMFGILPQIPSKMIFGIFTVQ